MIVANIFAEPNHYIGKKVNMAGDIMTIPQMKKAYQQETGIKPKSFKLPSLLVALMNREIYRQLKWNNQPGWQFNVSEVQARFPQMTSFRDFLKKNKAKLA